MHFLPERVISNLAKVYLRTNTHTNQLLHQQLASIRHLDLENSRFRTTPTVHSMLEKATVLTNQDSRIIA